MLSRSLIISASLLLTEQVLASPPPSPANMAVRMCVAEVVKKEESPSATNDSITKSVISRCEEQLVTLYLEIFPQLTGAPLW